MWPATCQAFAPLTKAKLASKFCLSLCLAASFFFLSLQTTTCFFFFFFFFFAIFPLLADVRERGKYAGE